MNLFCFPKLLENLLRFVVITVHNSSCGKVMFSQASTKDSVHRGGGSIHPHQVDIPQADTPWTDTPSGQTPP